MKISCITAVTVLYFSVITNKATAELVVGQQYEFSISSEFEDVDFRNETDQPYLLSGAFDSTFRFEVLDLQENNAPGIYFQKLGFFEGSGSMSLSDGTSFTMELLSGWGELECYGEPHVPCEFGIIFSFWEFWNLPPEESDSWSTVFAEGSDLWITMFDLWGTEESLETNQWTTSGGTVHIDHPEFGTLYTYMDPFFDSGSVTLTPVPAPASFPLLLAAIAGRRSRK